MMPLTKPVFVKAMANESRGGDPLGLETACSSLYQSVFAGLNNNVQYIRVYSAMCWMIQQVNQHLGHNPPDEEKDSAFRSGLPKMLLLLVWANRNKNLTGLPGIQRDWSPKGGKLHFSFESMPTRPAQNAAEEESEEGGSEGIHFMMPTQYWPSFKTGLALLKNTNENSWVMDLTDEGEALGEVFGKTLRALDPALLSWLRNPFKITHTPEKLAPLNKALALNMRPSRDERELFLEQFFPLSARAWATYETFEERSKGLTLVLRVLANHAARDDEGHLSVENIRQAMGVGLLADCSPVDTLNIEETQHAWRALQLSQYLRLALEGLFRVAEVVTHQLATENSFLGTEHDRSTTGIATQIAHQAMDALQLNQDVTVQDLLATLQPQNVTTLYEAGLHSDLWNPHVRMKALIVKSKFNLSKGSPAVSASLALQGLLWCIAEYRSLPSQVQGHITTHPGLSRLSVLASDYANRPAETFFTHLVQEYVLKLHASTARERTWIDIRENRAVRNRFRIVEGDTGLERSPGRGSKLTEIKLMPDILRHALLLLTQAGLTDKNPAGTMFRLTDQGHQWVARAWR